MRVHVHYRRGICTRKEKKSWVRVRCCQLTVIATKDLCQNGNDGGCDVGPVNDAWDANP